MTEKTNNTFSPKTLAHVDLAALEHNFRALKLGCSDKVKIMAVVKANAYGHGAVEVGRTVLAQGASALAVTRISEARQLRDAGIVAPILLFGSIFPDQVGYVANANICATMSSLDVAKKISHTALALGLRVKAHIKLDTGMGRLGIVPFPKLADAVDEIMAITRLKGLKIQGLYTHFANADSADKTHAKEQLNLFLQIKAALAQKGFCPVITHAASSAAAIEMPQTHFDMIRPGIALYGLWPSNEIDHGLMDLKPVMSVTSKIIQLKQVSKGFKVSYGSTYVTKQPTTIATIPIGYADGYSRLLSSRGQMLIKGIRVPVLGRVCMDFTMVDVSKVPNVSLEDDVVIIGTQGKETISADQIARLTNTISYEVLTGLALRMPIQYHRNKRPGHCFDFNQKQGSY